ncbi:MAG: sulfur transferase domain-containing protein [Vicinamibacterales bacterium]
MQATLLRSVALTALCGLLSAPAGAQQVNREQMPGVRNLTRIDSTVACAGAITPAAVGDIKDMGYGAIINLRLATEQGADIEGHTAAAQASGIRYIHIPFSSTNPEPAAVDAFLTAITSPGVEPAFIHCAGGGRAAGMWLMKRAIVDGWDVDQAMDEATTLGLTNEGLKRFFVQQIRQRRH